MNTQTPTHRTPHPRPAARSVAGRGARARDIGLIASAGLLTFGWWARRQTADAVLVLRFLGAHPDSTALAVSNALPLKVTRVLAVLDHLTLKGVVEARWLGEDCQRRRLYRVAARGQR